MAKPEQGVAVCLAVDCVAVHMFMERTAIKWVYYNKGRKSDYFCCLPGLGRLGSDRTDNVLRISVGCVPTSLRCPPSLPCVA